MRYARLLAGGMVVWGLLGLGCGSSEADPCAGLRCSEGEVCDADQGRCVAADSCAGVTCDPGTACDPADGTCQPVAQCAGDTDCQATERCSSASVCVSRCEGVTCQDGTSCEPTTGLCTGGQASCTVDEDCQVAAGEVCDAGTCRGGVGADCTADPASCASGHRCVAGFQGGVSLCLATCSESGTCAVHERCVPPEEDAVLGGTCYLNLCGPDGGAGVQVADYQGPCDAAGSGDGRCVGPLDDGQGGTLGVGICTGVGTAEAGASCVDDARHGASEACVAGAWCGVRPGEATGTCLALCALFDGADCEPVSGVPTTCYALWETAGVCLEQQDPATEVGATCTEGTDSALACVEDALCVTEEGGADSVCRAACDPAATDGPATCAAGTCTALVGQPSLGVCQ